MPASDTLQRVADLLAPAERERFLTTIAKFRSIPEDDEYLLVLESIGFMTLIWNRVPNEVHSILEGSKPASLSTDYLRAQIRESIGESLPSFEDLRQISQSMKQQQLIMNRQANRGVAEPTPSTALCKFFFYGVIVGVTLSTLAQLIFPWPQC